MKSLIQSLVVVTALSLPAAALAELFFANGSRFISPDGALAAFASAGFLLTALSDYRYVQRRLLRPVVCRQAGESVASLTLAR